MHVIVCTAYNFIYILHSCMYECMMYVILRGVNGVTHLKNRAKMALVAIFISKAGKMMHTIALE